MRRLLSSCALLLGLLPAKAQSHKLDWAIKQGGPQNEKSYSVTADKNGNVYTSGVFNGTVDFDPGPGTYTLSAGIGEQAFISKVNASGKLVWAKMLKSTGGDCRANCIRTDTGDMVYLCGSFTGTVDFDPGPGTHPIIATFGTNAFVLRLDTAGAFSWVARAESASATSLAIDRHGTVHVTGIFARDMRLYDTDDFYMFNLTSSGDYDLFLWALGSSGWMEYAVNAASAGGNYTYGSSVTVDTLNNVYCTGNFTGTASFPFGPGASSLTAKGGKDVFLFLMTKFTGLKWAKSFGSTKDDQGLSVTVDNSGDAITCGEFSGSTDFDPGSGSTILSPATLAGYVCRFNDTGGLVWAKGMMGAGTAGNASCFTLAGQNDGNVYVGGGYGGTVDLDPGADKYEVTAAAGKQNMFLLKMDTSGAMTWAKTTGGMSSVLLSTITTDNTGNLYTTGYFNGLTDFNPGAGIAELTPSGGYDNFTCKFSACTADSTKDTLSACGSYVFGGKRYTSSGNYLLVAANSSGCDSLINLNLTINPGIDTITISGSVLSAKTAGATYQWITCPGNTIIPGATSQDYTATTTGAYAVVVSNGTCTDTSDCLTVTGTGLSDPATNDLVKVYPNPAAKLITVTLPAPATGISIQISSLSGQVVLQQDQLSGSTFSIDLSGLASGMYFLKVSDQDKLISLRKLVKQ